MNTSNTIVLVGGSGLGPWAWARVTPLLTEHGHQVLTPRLRTVRDGPTGAREVILQDWVEDVSEALTGYDNVTLVAHSFAGYIAAALAELQQNSVRQTVFLDAILPQPSKSWFDVMGPEASTFMTSLARNGEIPWFSREQLDQLYPSHGITEADVAWMQSNVVPQPIGTYAAPAIKGPLSTTLPTAAYVQCVKTDPPAADLTDFPHWHRRTIRSGHWPMITNPADTANIILELAGT